MVLNSKKRALFFSAGEQEMNMNAYEEYKTIIMAKFNTTTAVRARCVGMFFSASPTLQKCITRKKAQDSQCSTVVFAINGSRRSCKLMIPCRLNRERSDRKSTRL